MVHAWPEALILVVAIPDLVKRVALFLLVEDVNSGLSGVNTGYAKWQLEILLLIVLIL